MINNSDHTTESDAMAEQIDEGYVIEILADARPGMTREQFRHFVRKDVAAGWRAEADEAERRYFARESRT